MSNKPFLLYSNCLLVRGYLRSSICDLQRGTIHMIPNTLAELLVKYQGSNISHIKENYEQENHNIIDEYFEFLQEQELIFFTDTPELFPALNPEWHAPSVITNAIILCSAKLLVSQFLCYCLWQ